MDGISGKEHEDEDGEKDGEDRRKKKVKLRSLAAWKEIIPLAVGPPIKTNYLGLARG